MLLKKLKTYLYPNIANISIIVGVVAIVVHLISAYLQIHYRDVYIDTFRYLKNFIVVVEFYDSLPYFLSYFFDDNYHPTGGYNPFTLLFFTMLTMGGVIYRKTEGKDDRLLKFSFSTIFIFQVVGILSLVYGYIDFKFINEQTATLDKSIFYWVWHMVYLIPYMIISYLFTKWLIEDQDILIKSKTKQNGQRTSHVIESGNGKRVLHWIFDKLLMTFVFSPFFFKAINYQRGTYYDIDYLTLSLISVFALTFYYLISEGFFGATPIKFLTGTTVINEDTNQKAGFKKIVGRTLSRHIPLEALSFIDGRGWHDSIPRTKVVSVNKGRARTYHLVWGIAVLMIYLGPTLYSSTQKYFETRRKNNFIEQARLKKQKSFIYNLDKGDAIITNHKTAERKSPYTLLKIISSNKDTINAERYLMPYSNKPYQESLINYKDSALNILDTFHFAREKLLDNYSRRKYFKFIKSDSISYKIYKVFDFDHIKIRKKSSYSRITKDTVVSTFRFTHDRMPVEVIDFKTFEGNVHLQSKLPIKSYFNKRSNKGAFDLVIEHYKTNKVYKAELTLKYNDSTYLYIFEGLDRHIEIYKKVEGEDLSK